MAKSVLIRAFFSLLSYVNVFLQVCCEFQSPWGFLYLNGWLPLLCLELGVPGGLLRDEGKHFNIRIKMNKSEAQRYDKL